jgi:hypothetical protein
MLHPLKPKRTHRRARHSWGRKLYLCDRILQVAPRVNQLTQDSYGYQYASDVGYYKEPGFAAPILIAGITESLFTYQGKGLADFVSSGRGLLTLGS